MKLSSLSDIFKERVLRIPDYQRGYSWQKHQLSDFWEDLIQLDSDKAHYTGVITLEPVSKKNYNRWEQDIWIIDGKGYSPFYIVDGQQRLTTSIVLIQSILEILPKDAQLNYQSFNEISNKYVLHKAEDGQRESFLFGYEKDNPSDEFLRTEILGKYSHSNEKRQTLYTRNLVEAKIFFKEKLKDIALEDVEKLFKKLTQKFKFNVYEIDEEIDVFVTFETMNNRGKPLTSLELLKNRLIYLSTLFQGHEGKEVLRRKINEAWKTIYEYLGKSPEVKLDDNLFLKNHWIMYFKYSRRRGDDYIRFLLEEKFSPRNVTHPKNKDDQLTVNEIEEYVTSLQKSVRPWFYMHNPIESNRDYDDEENKILIESLNRIGFKAFRPLILAAYVSGKDFASINKLLEAMERYNFSLFTLSQRRSNTGDSEFYGFARDLLFGEKDISFVIKKIEEWVDRYYDPTAFLNHISEKYKIGRDGFYHWEGLKYFLYENEQWLKKDGKQYKQKIDWKSFNEYKNGYETIEHIFPQNISEQYWKDRFESFTEEQRLYLTHSLGNLLPLSRAKNSAMQNYAFDIKKDNGKSVGYYNGSVSENEVAKKSEWSAKNILERGMDLLNFMEDRWKITLGDEKFKRQLLHLDFLIDHSV